MWDQHSWVWPQWHHVTAGHFCSGWCDRWWGSSVRWQTASCEHWSSSVSTHKQMDCPLFRFPFSVFSEGLLNFTNLKLVSFIVYWWCIINLLNYWYQRVNQIAYSEFRSGVTMMMESLWNDGTNDLFLLVDFNNTHQRGTGAPFP